MSNHQLRDAAWPAPTLSRPKTSASQKLLPLKLTHIWRWWAFLLIEHHDQLRRRLRQDDPRASRPYVLRAIKESAIVIDSRIPARNVRRLVKNPLHQSRLLVSMPMMPFRPRFVVTTLQFRPQRLVIERRPQWRLSRPLRPVSTPRPLPKPHLPPVSKPTAPRPPTRIWYQ